MRSWSISRQSHYYSIVKYSYFPLKYKKIPHWINPCNQYSATNYALFSMLIIERIDSVLKPWIIYIPRFSYRIILELWFMLSLIDVSDYIIIHIPRFSYRIILELWFMLRLIDVFEYIIYTGLFNFPGWNRHTCSKYYSRPLHFPFWGQSPSDRLW